MMGPPRRTNLFPFAQMTPPVPPGVAPPPGTIPPGPPPGPGVVPPPGHIDPPVPQEPKGPQQTPNPFAGPPPPMYVRNLGWRVDGGADPNAPQGMKVNDDYTRWMENQDLYSNWLKDNKVDGMSLGNHDPSQMGKAQMMRVLDRRLDRQNGVGGNVEPPGHIDPPPGGAVPPPPGPPPHIDPGVGEQSNNTLLAQLLMRGRR
jgi:hypothetical protein